MRVAAETSLRRRSLHLNSQFFDHTKQLASCENIKHFVFKIFVLLFGGLQLDELCTYVIKGIM